MTDGGYEKLYRDIFDGMPNVKVPCDTGERIRVALQGTRTMQVRLLSMEYGLDGTKRECQKDAAHILGISEGRAKELMTRTMRTLRSERGMHILTDGVYDAPYRAEDLDGLPIEWLGLSGRVLLAAKRAGILTVGQAARDPEKIMDAGHAGEWCRDELERTANGFLEKNGIRREELK